VEREKGETDAKCLRLPKTFPTSQTPYFSFLEGGKEERGGGGLDWLSFGWRLPLVLVSSHLTFTEGRRRGGKEGCEPRRRSFLPFKACIGCASMQKRKERGGEGRRPAPRWVRLLAALLALTHREKGGKGMERNLVSRSPQGEKIIWAELSLCVCGRGKGGGGGGGGIWMDLVPGL